MDRGAALNCRVIHNWDEKKMKRKNEDEFNESENEDN